MLGDALRRRSVAACDRAFGTIFCSSFALLFYLLSAPFAELYFHFLVKRFIARQRTSDHMTFHALVNPAEAIRFWEMQLRESPHQLLAMLRGWFDPSDPSLALCRENVAEFLVWNLHNVRRERADAWQRATAEALLEKIESVVGRLPAGYEPRLRCLSYTLAPWPTCRTPLLAYLLFGVGRRLLEGYLSWVLGFERASAGRLSYYVRPPVDTYERPRPPPPPPLVLLHGVLGLLPYGLLLRQMVATHAGAVLVPVFEHCAVRLEHLCARLPPPQDAPELVHSIRAMVARHATTTGGRAPHTSSAAGNYVVKDESLLPSHRSHRGSLIQLV